MKKFEPDVFVNAWGVQVLDMVESKRGEWVQADLAEEMLEALKECNDKFRLDDEAAMQEGFTPIYASIRSKIQSIIKKAEGA